MDQIYPKKGGERWIKLLLTKNGSEKKLCTIEAHSPIHRILNNFGKNPQ